MAFNENNKSKTSNILQIIGMLLISISIFLILASLGLLPDFPMDQSFLNYGMLLLAASFFVLFLSILTGMNKDIKKFEEITTIRCRNPACKYILIRDFKKNDYVFKDLKKPCPKCNSTIHITNISSIPTKKIKEKPNKDIRSKKPNLDKKEKKFKTITTLKCENHKCDFIKIRNFKLNDYIFKKFDERSCSKCGSILYISEISHKIPKEAK